MESSDSLVIWTSDAQPLGIRVRLCHHVGPGYQEFFDSCQQAIAYAKEHGIERFYLMAAPR